MQKWPVLVINMNKSTERKCHIKATFKNESLIFVTGFDPTGWTREKFVDENILNKTKLKGPSPTIGEIGCALGHREAWQWAVDNLRRSTDKVIVIEDDIEPTEHYNIDFQKSVSSQSGINENADVTFLCHHGGWGCPEKTRFSDGRWRSGSGNYGYVITKKGAIDAINMQFPMKFACDIQWRNDKTMYVIEKPIVTQSSIGRFSTIGKRF